MRKLGPYVVIIVVGGLALFFMGSSYGYNTKISNEARERFDKNFSAFIKKQNLFHEPNFSYYVYTNKACQISFILPNQLREKKIDEDTFEFSHQDKRFIFLECNLKDLNVDTQPNQEKRLLLLDSYPQIVKTSKSVEYSYIINQKHQITINKEIFPLIQATISIH